MRLGPGTSRSRRVECADLPERFGGHVYAAQVDPTLPIYPAEASNGEFVPRPPTERDRAMAREIHASIDHTAQRLHLDRRALLHRASGVAATLAVFNLFGCSSG